MIIYKIECDLLRIIDNSKHCPDTIFVNFTNNDANGTVPEQSINKNCELEVIFEMDVDKLIDEGKSFHIQLSTSKDTSLACPILFAIFHQQHIIAVKLPYSFDALQGSTSSLVSTPKAYYDANRTLCIIKPHSTGDNGRNVKFHISTCSGSNVSFNIKAGTQTNVIDGNITYDVTVAPTKPRYFIYKFNGSAKIVKVITQSQDDVCMIVSIQKSYCPIYEQEFNVKYGSGPFKTMTRSSVVVVKRKGQFSEGFAVVFVVKENDLECLGSRGSTDKGSINDERIKNFTVHLKEEAYIEGITPMGLLLPFLYALIGLLLLGGYKIHQKYLIIWTSEDQDIKNESSPLITSTSDINRNVQTNLHLSDFRVRTRDIDHNRADTIRERTGPDHCRRRNNPKNFWTTLLLVAFLYAVPVVELVVNFVVSEDIDGNFDNCFYNELCLHGFTVVPSFNNSWSNMSYIILGILFCFVVQCREKNFKDGSSKRGIEFHKELFYALGIGLMMEGVFSGTYHLCPNKFTFQYDTTFMFVIACLILVHIFLSRHPVTQFTAPKTYGSLTILVMLTAISYFVDESNNATTKASLLYAYLAFQTFVVLVLIIYYCDVGLVKVDDELRNPDVSLLIVWKRVKYWSLYVFSCSRNSNYQNNYPFAWKRALIGIFILCLSIALFICLRDKQGLSAILLFTLVLVTVISTAYYILMKFCHSEISLRNKEQGILLILPATCFVISIFFWLGAISLFTKTSYDADDTPAQSRSINTECQYIGFYDNHDMWHMLSSVAIFSVYMGLLTIDDGLMKTPHEKIVVF